MSKVLLLATASCLSMLGSGCAMLRPSADLSPAPAATNVRLLAGPAVPAPSGLVAFCAREPEACSQSGDTSWQAARSRLTIANREEREHEILTWRRWRQLNEVNHDINHTIAPVPDQDQYGVPDYWTAPISLGAGFGVRGDCEDYALEKRARLIGLGWPPQSLVLAVVTAPAIGRHAVLVVQTDRGDLVLDNLHDEPRELASLGYEWLSRQSGPILQSWASARVEAPAALILEAQANVDNAIAPAFVAPLRHARRVQR